MKFQVKKEDFINRATFLDLICIIIGSVLWVIAVDAIVIPNNLLSGGLTGIAIMVNYGFPVLPVSVLVYVLNIPILLWAIKDISPRLIFYTIVAITLQSVMLELFKHMPSYTNDVLLACIFGGLIAGVGAGLIIRRRGSSGGSDILGIVIKKRYSFSVGTVGIAFNALVIGASVFLYGLEIAMYTLIFIFVCNFATDKTIEGLSKRYTAFIITEKPEEMKKEIFQSVHRGLTFIHGTGAFSGIRRNIIYCVINQYELANLKDILHNVDPNAFMTLTEAKDIYGSFRRKGAYNLESLKALEQEELDRVLAPIELPKNMRWHNDGTKEREY